MRSMGVTKVTCLRTGKAYEMPCPGDTYSPRFFWRWLFSSWLFPHR